MNSILPWVLRSWLAARWSRDAAAAVRWVTLVLLLSVALADPVPGWAGLPAWAFVLAFAAYSLATDLLRRRSEWLRSRPHVAATLDLVVVGSLYLLAGEHDGPLYALFFLAVVNAAATLSLRGALLYAVAAAAIITIAELTLRQAAPTNEVVLDIGGRTIVLALVVAGTAVLVRRLSVAREATRAARDEAERLAELERLRGSFVAAVSHDLQTPLTAVRAGLGLLEASAIDRLRPDEHQVLSNARRNAERLGLQIDDLLTFNQLEADAFQLDTASFDARQVIADVVAVTHPLVEQKGQELQVDVAVPLPVAGDQRRLGQALVNLVVNAHQHTPAGTRIAIAGRITPG